MIVKVPKPGITDYELKYFMEADTPARKNIRRITIADSGKAAVNGVEKDDDDVGLDTDDLADDEDIETDDTPETDDDVDVDDIDLDDDELDMDDEDLGDDEETDTAGDTPDVATDDEGTGDDDIATDGEDSTGGADAEGGGADAGGGGDVAIDGEGDGADDAGAEGDGGGDAGDGGEDTSAGSPEDKKAAIQKFNLFTKMRDLHETAGKYIEKINMLIAYNTDNTAAYQKVCDDFDEMRSYLYEFMLVKFEQAKYSECMLFYQRATTLMYVILEDLDAIEVGGKDGKKKPARKSDTKETSKEKSGKKE